MGTMAAASGSRILGKYTFVTRGRFATRLVLEPVSDDVKYCIGRRPERTSCGYGMFPEGKLANLPNTIT